MRQHLARLLCQPRRLDRINGSPANRHKIKPRMRNGKYIQTLPSRGPRGFRHRSQYLGDGEGADAIEVVDVCLLVAHIKRIGGVVNVPLIVPEHHRSVLLDTVCVSKKPSPFCPAPGDGFLSSRHEMGGTASGRQRAAGADSRRITPTTLSSTSHRPSTGGHRHAITREQ